MSDSTDPAGPAVTRGEVARGAGLAGLSRAGAFIEALAQPLYIWMFGLAAYGIYVVLWGAINLLTNLLDLSMTSALQRIVPTRSEETQVHGAVKLALLVTILPSLVVALLVALNADSVATLFSVAPEDRSSLPGAIALFVWALPLWTSSKWRRRRHGRAGRSVLRSGSGSCGSSSPAFCSRSASSSSASEARG